MLLIKMLRLFVVLLMQAISLQAEEEEIPKTPPQVIEKLYQIMYDTHHLFSTHDIEYWIEAGTLLGAVRNQGLIQWDTDLDLDLPIENLPHLLALEPIIRKLGYKLVKWPDVGYRIGYAHPVEQIYPYVDIFLVERLVDGIAYVTDWAKAYYEAEKCRASHTEKYHFRLEDLYPLKQYPFGLFFVTGPAEPTYHLEKWYGTSYWNHAEVPKEICYRFQNGKQTPLLNFILTEDLLVAAKPYDRIHQRSEQLLSIGLFEDEYEYIKNLLQKTMTVFEWSTGPSAKEFSSCVKEYHSTIPISVWGSEGAFLPSTTYYIKPVSEEPESKRTYAQAITATDRLFDLILIRGLEKKQCAQISKKYLASHGMVIIDNYTSMLPKEKAIILQDYILQGTCNTLGVFTPSFFPPTAKSPEK